MKNKKKNRNKNRNMKSIKNKKLIVKKHTIRKKLLKILSSETFWNILIMIITKIFF